MGSGGGAKQRHISAFWASADGAERLVGTSDGWVLSTISPPPSNRSAAAAGGIGTAFRQPTADLAASYASLPSLEPLGQHKAAVTGIGMLYLPPTSASSSSMLGTSGGGTPSAAAAGGAGFGGTLHKRQCAKIVVSGSADGTVRLWAAQGPSSGGGGGGGAASDAGSPYHFGSAAFEADSTDRSVAEFSSSIGGGSRGAGPAHAQRRCVQLIAAHDGPITALVVTGYHLSAAASASVGANARRGGAGGGGALSSSSLVSGGAVTGGESILGGATAAKTSAASSSSTAAPLPLPTIVTASVDKTVKVWQIDATAARTVAAVRFEARQIFSFNFWVTALWASPLEALLFGGVGAGGGGGGGAGGVTSFSAFAPNGGAGGGSPSPSSTATTLHTDAILVGGENGTLSVLSVNSGYVPLSAASGAPFTASSAGGASSIGRGRGGGAAVENASLNPMAAAYYGRNSNGGGGGETDDGGGGNGPAGDWQLSQQLQQQRRRSGPLGTAFAMRNKGPFTLTRQVPIASVGGGASSSSIRDGNKKVGRRRGQRGAAVYASSSDEDGSGSDDSMSKPYPRRRRESAAAMNSGGGSSSSAPYPTGIIRIVPIPSSHLAIVLTHGPRAHIINTFTYEAAGTIPHPDSAGAGAVGTGGSAASSAFSPLFADGDSDGGGVAAAGGGGALMPLGAAAHFVDCISVLSPSDEALLFLDSAGTLHLHTTNGSRWLCRVAVGGGGGGFSSNVPKLLARIATDPAAFFVAERQQLTLRRVARIAAAACRAHGDRVVAIVPLPKKAAMSIASSGGGGLSASVAASWGGGASSALDISSLPPSPTAAVGKGLLPPPAAIDEADLLTAGADGAISCWTMDMELVKRTDADGSTGGGGEGGGLGMRPGRNGPDTDDDDEGESFSWSGRKRAGGGAKKKRAAEVTAVLPLLSHRLVVTGHEDGAMAFRSADLGAPSFIRAHDNTVCAIFEGFHRRERGGGGAAVGGRNSIVGRGQRSNARSSGNDDGGVRLVPWHHLATISFDGCLALWEIPPASAVTGTGTGTVVSSSSNAVGSSTVGGGRDASAAYTARAARCDTRIRVSSSELLCAAYEPLRCLYIVGDSAGSVTVWALEQAAPILRLNHCGIGMGMGLGGMGVGMGRTAAPPHLVGWTGGGQSGGDQTPTTTASESALSESPTASLAAAHVGLQRAHTGAATAVVLDGNYCFSSGDDGAIFMWSLSTGEALLSLFACSRIVEMGGGGGIGGNQNPITAIASSMILSKGVLLPVDDIVSMCRLANGDLIACARGRGGDDDDDGGGEWEGAAGRRSGGMARGGVGIGPRHIIVRFGHAADYQPVAYCRLPAEPCCMALLERPAASPPQPALLGDVPIPPNSSSGGGSGEVLAVGLASGRIEFVAIADLIPARLAS